MKKVTILTGHYGSGKSEFAISYALFLKNKFKKVYIADLDVINLYFRSREQEEFLNKNNIEILGNVLGSDISVDIPHISANIYKPLFEEESHLIIDLAGTENGLKVLNSLFEDKQFNYDMFVLINKFRDNTETKDEIKSVIYKLNNYTKYSITGIINNSNLMNHTTKEDIFEAHEILEKVSNEIKIPIKYNVISINNVDIEKKFKLNKIYLNSIN